MEIFAKISEGFLYSSFYKILARAGQKTL